MFFIVLEQACVLRPVLFIEGSVPFDRISVEITLKKLGLNLMRTYLVFSPIVELYSSVPFLEPFRIPSDVRIFPIDDLETSTMKFVIHPVPFHFVSLCR